MRLKIGRMSYHILLRCQYGARREKYNAFKIPFIPVNNVMDQFELNLKCYNALGCQAENFIEGHDMRYGYMVILLSLKRLSEKYFLRFVGIALRLKFNI